MERGDGWTCLYEGYASKPRPVFIVQDNAVSGQFGSTVMCLITSFVSDDIPTRVRIEPSPANGLKRISRRKPGAQAPGFLREILLKKQGLPDREPLRIFGGEGGIRTLETRYI